MKIWIVKEERRDQRNSNVKYWRNGFVAISRKIWSTKRRGKSVCGVTGLSLVPAVAIYNSLLRRGRHSQG